MIGVYEKKIQCSKCNEMVTIHFPNSFSDHQVLRCGLCNKEIFLSVYDDVNGKYFFHKWFKYEHPVLLDEILENNAAIEMSLESCDCGGRFQFVGWFTPVICKCGQILKVENNDKRFKERWEENITVQIEPEPIKWRFNK